MGAEKTVLIGGGISGLAYLSTLSKDALSEVLWVRGPEGLSALGAGAIEIFEPLVPVSSNTTRKEFYEAMRLRDAALPPWTDAEERWLNSLNAFGTRLGWAPIDQLQAFRWFPHEDGTLVPVAGNWLTGASDIQTKEIVVVFCGVESEEERIVDGWNYDSERLGLPFRWEQATFSKEEDVNVEGFAKACLKAAGDRRTLALHRLPQNLSWFDLRDQLAKLSDIQLIPVGGIGGRGLAFEAIERLRASFVDGVSDIKRGRVASVKDVSAGTEVSLSNETFLAKEVQLALGRGGAPFAQALRTTTQAPLIGSVVEELNGTCGGWIDTHRSALEGVTQ